MTMVKGPFDGTLQFLPCSGGYNCEAMEFTGDGAPTKRCFRFIAEGEECPNHGSREAVTAARAVRQVERELSELEHWRTQLKNTREKLCSLEMQTAFDAAGVLPESWMLIDRMFLLQIALDSEIEAP